MLLKPDTNFVFGEGEEKIITISFPSDEVVMIYPVKYIEMDRNKAIHIYKTDNSYVLINNNYNMLEINNLSDNIDRLEND